MSETIEDLTVEYIEDGITKVKQLDKEILSKGAWCTIMFKYQDWNAKDNAYGPEKFSIRRFQKQNGRYFLKSKFTISSKDQAEKIIAVLKKWMS